MAEKRKGGRPLSYKPEFVEQAQKLAQLAATDAELADFFHVTIRTICDWKVKFPEFSQALKLGKEAADDRVSKSLYQRAMGYSFEAEKIFMPSGAKKPVRVAYREHVPPDTTACIFWLKNRQPDQWRDRQHHEHTGRNGGPIQTLDLSNATDEQLDALKALVGAASLSAGGDPPGDRGGTGETQH